MSSSVQCILLTQKAEVKPIKVSYTGNTISTKDIQTALKKKESPQKLGDYSYKQNILSLYGYTKGRAGTENKHELPPPHDTVLAFGDILLLVTASTSGKPVPFKPEDYETFYTKMFGGFDDIDSEDSETEDEEEEDVENAGEDAEGDEEGVEEDEGEEEEEESESEEEDDEEGGGDEFDAGDDDIPPPVVKKAKAPKKKKAAPSLLVAQTGASQIIHVPIEELLTEDTTDLSRERQHTIQILKGILNNQIPAESLEAGVFKATIQEAQRRHVTCHWKNTLFKHIYTTKIRQVTGNILPNSYVQNPNLLKEMKSGKYSLEEVCSFDAYKLSNERWKDYFHRRQQQEKRQLEGNKAMATDQFLCTRCHKRECTYYEMQTRSADEPMTIFITCMNCGKHWRQ